MADRSGRNWKLLIGDCRDRLADLPEGSVQTCITSPPYWGLRDYGVDGQMGLEETPDDFLSAMVEVFRSVWRVLRDDGTLWVNMGDSYANTNGLSGTPADIDHGGTSFRGGRYEKQPCVGIPLGLKQKDLCGMPWRLAFALQSDGWYLRSDIIWSKPNPMPESVTDRPAKAHEYIFLLTKRPRYFYDADAIREPVKHPNVLHKSTHTTPAQVAAHFGNPPTNLERCGTDANGRNKRTVWEIPTQPYSEAHFATFPEALVVPCVLAGSREGDTVLDPFAGSGTTGKVSVELGREFIGVELNPEYADLAAKRITNPKKWSIPGAVSHKPIVGQAMLFGEGD